MFSLHAKKDVRPSETRGGTEEKLDFQKAKCSLFVGSFMEVLKYLIIFAQGAKIRCLFVDVSVQLDVFGRNHKEEWGVSLTCWMVYRACT